MYSWPYTFPTIYIHDLPDYPDDINLYSKFDQPSDLWQQLDLVSELESDLRDTVDWSRTWLVDFNASFV